jgi:hypothetical protein
MNGMNSGENKDLRKYERLPFREHVLIDGSKRCTTTDISEGGLFVSAIQYFEEKSVVEVSIPFGGTTVKVKGQVQFYQSGIGIGIRFIDLTDTQRSQIRGLLNSLKARTA